MSSDNTAYAIPDTVTTVKSTAFLNAGNLKTVTLGAKVGSDQLKSIRGQLRDIKAFKVNSKNSSYRAKDGVLFNKKGDTLLLYPNGKGTSYMVPKGTITIEKEGFYLSKLQKITLPEGLKTIKSGAFSNCKSLTTITIPISVTKMDVGDFKELYTLKSFHIQSGSKLYASYEGILYNTTKTKIIFVPKAYDKTVLKFPSTLTGLSLGSINLSKITEINIPKALKELEVYSGRGCFNKITLETGNKNFTLYKGSLYNKDKTKLYLFKKQEKPEFPGTLKEINAGYLLGSGIKEMVLPKNAELVGASVYDITTLEKFSIAADSKYYTMKDEMLLSKDGTVLYDIPKDKTELIIPDNVMEVDTLTIFYGRNLTKITIPKSLTEFDYYDLRELKSLRSVEVDKDNSAYASIEGVFYNKDFTELLYYPVNKEDKTFIMPDTVKNILSNGFQSLTDNPYMESITLPAALEYKKQSSYDGFQFSKSLKEIKVAEGNAYYVSVDGVLYNKDMTELVAYPYQKKDTSFTIPDTVITAKALCYTLSTWLNETDYTKDAYSNPYLETLVVGKNAETLFAAYDGYPVWDFKKLRTIEVSGDNPYFSAKDGILYNKDFTVMYLYPKNCRNTVLTIPSSVKEIQDTFLIAAENNSYLKSIVVEVGNKMYSTDGNTLRNYAGNHKYFSIGDTDYNKKIYHD